MSTDQFLDRLFRNRLRVPLETVAEVTSLPLGPLLRDCRAGRVEHHRRHGKYYLTREHLEALLEADTRKARPSAQPKTLAAVAVASDDASVDSAALEAWAARKRRQLARKAG